MYVGQSLSAINRLGQHKNNSHWFAAIARVEIAHFATRQEALDAERAAIEKENPLHNLQRPKMVEPKTEEVRAALAKATLVRHIVFQPMYDRRAVAGALHVSENEVERLWDLAKLGYVRVGVRQTQPPSPLRMTTGWQLIDYIESLEQRLK